MSIAHVISQLHDPDQWTVSFITDKNTDIGHMGSRVPEYMLVERNLAEIMQTGEITQLTGKTPVWSIKFKNNHTKKVIDAGLNQDAAIALEDFVKKLRQYVRPIKTNTNTGAVDKNGNQLRLGDKVRFLPADDTGTIVCESCAYGIAFEDPVDWDKIQTACGQSVRACYNDNFISLWEIAWNFSEPDGTFTTITLENKT